MLIVVLFCIVPSFAQDTKITNSNGKTIDFGSPDLQLKYILNNEFSRLITANSFAGLGNYAAVSTKDKTLSAAINIVRKKSIIEIKASGGATDGVVTLFQNNDVNTDITLGASLHRIVGKPGIAVNVTNINKINETTRQLEDKFNGDSLKVLTIEFDSDKQMKAKVKEIEGVNDLIISNQYDPEKARIYSHQRDLLLFELSTMRAQKEKQGTDLPSIIQSLRSVVPFDPVKFKADSLAAVAYEYSFDKKIKAKEVELKDIDELIKTNVHDLEKEKLYLQNLALLSRDTFLLNRDLKNYKAHRTKIMGQLRYDRNAAIQKNWASVDAIQAEDLHIKWVTFGGDLTQNAFKLFDRTKPEDKQRVEDKTDITPSLLFAFSGFTNVAMGGKPNSRHLKFYSFGTKIKFGNNISRLELLEVTTTDSISPTQGLVKKENAYVGDFDSNDVTVTIFGDYYRFIGNRDNVGYHIRGTVDVGDFKPVTSFRAGLLFPFVKIDDKASFLNLEFFIGLNDVFNNDEGESALKRNVVGLQATVPFNFKIL